MYRWFLAFRWLFTRPINLLGVLAITLGVWALIVVVSIFSGYIHEISRHLQSSTADMTAARLPPDASFDRMAAVLRRDPNVAAVAPRIVWQGLVHPLAGAQQKAPPAVGVAELGAPTPYVTLLGVDFAAEDAVSGIRAWIEGVSDPAERVADPEHPFASDSGPAAILMGASRMAIDDLHRGARAKITTGRLVAERGHESLSAPAPEEYRIAGAYESSFAAFESLNVLIDIEALRAQIRHDDQPDLGPDWCNELAIRLIDKGDAEGTAQRLQRILNTEFDPDYGHILVRTWAEANAPQLANFEHQRSLLILVLFVIMVVAAFQVYATMSMTVTEKQHDIGILAALGGKRGGILTLFLVNGVAIATLGAVLGVGTGCATALGLDGFNEFLKHSFGIDLFPVRVYNLRHVPHELDPQWIGVVSGSAILIGALVSAIPAWRASRHDPAVSLRND